jgi:hypothetical protein
MGKAKRAHQRQIHREGAKNYSRPAIYRCPIFLVVDFSHQ